MSDDIRGPESERLHYTIHSSSGHTASFRPDHILTDNPSDQSSRWTGATSGRSNDDQQQVPNSGRVSAGNQSLGEPQAKRRKRDVLYIVLELDRPAVVAAIGFGKYHKTHPCNLYEFSAYGGMSPDIAHMQPLHHGTLKNDTKSELINLPMDITAAGRPSVLLPVKYIRIDAYSAHTQNYNVSIWHVWLEGMDSPAFVEPAIEAFEDFRSTYTSHLMLAHLRRSYDLREAFRSLRDRVTDNVSKTFEHPLLTLLHETLVEIGSYTKTEVILDRALEHGLLTPWASGGGKETSIARWQCLGPNPTARKVDDVTDLGEEELRWPSRRGGHQMIRVERKLLLFGGWDGERDLGDLWEYELPRSSSTADDEGFGKWRCLELGNNDPGAQTSRGGRGENDGPPLRPTARSCHQMAVDDSEGWVYLLGAKLSPEDELESEQQDQENSGGVSGRRGRAARDAEGGHDGAEVAMDVEDSSVTSATKRGASPDLRSSPWYLSPWSSDFWRYKAAGPGKGTWELLSGDTRQEKGPSKLFDHQMFVHSESQKLFVFGGKSQTWSPSADTYSGMYCYDIASRTWSHLFGDPTSQDTFRSERLLARFGHSMIYDAADSTIYIMAGQRRDLYLSDLWSVKLASPGDDESEAKGHPSSSTTRSGEIWRQGVIINSPVETLGLATNGTDPTISARSSATRQPIILSIRSLSSDYSVDDAGPPAAFTQRTLLNPVTREWTVLSGLVRDRRANREVPGGEVWMWSPATLKPVLVHATQGGSAAASPSSGIDPLNDSGTGVNVDTGTWMRIQQRGPRPAARYAAQAVFDPLREEHYLFGGNPSQTGEVPRLNDLWRLSIVRPSPEEALRQAKFLVRKQCFTEMCQTRPTLVALDYLQTELASVVDHHDESESAAFRSCMAALLSAPARNNCEVDMTRSELASGHNEEDEDQDDDDEDNGLGGCESESSAGNPELYAARHALFERLLEFVPDRLRQPRDELQDLAMRSVGNGGTGLRMVR